ncbi:nuclear transport factor 2 family protein [Lentzea sp. NPDC051213]|uniref:nuclear transport factor 2 family protein n=1 Tax=Lentzea sp. NPDC051213 TaxID=3364126 RepID=UPI00379B1CB9
MSDIDEIRALTHRYALLLDTVTDDGIDQVFTEDAVFDATAIDLPVLTGREAIRGFWRAIFELTTHTAHTVSNHLVDPDGATGTYYLRAEMMYKDGSTSLVTVLNTDTYRRTEHGLRIAHRTVRPLLPLVRTSR